jgi:hypothetical protein
MKKIILTNKLIHVAVLSILFLGFKGLSFAQNNMSVIAEFQGEHHNSGYGMSMASLDFNYDGYDDLVVCSSFYGYVAGQTPSRGKVYVYLGGPDFSSSTQASITVEGTFNGSSGRWITAVYKVGDVNGDGYDDLCIRDEAPRHEADKRLMIFYGGTNNLDTPDHVISYPDSTYIVTVRELFDVNGDGYDDIGVAYRPWSSPNAIFSIYFGEQLTEGIVTTFPQSSGMYSLSGIGDVDNDGYADFTIGCTDYDPDTGYHLVRFYYGNAECNFSNPLVMIQTQEPITKVSKPLGDVNGDGYGDFMGYVSNYGMHAWLGGPSIDISTPDFNFDPAIYGGETTQSLEFGDLNNDGFDDVVGASFYQRRFSVWMGKQHMNGTSDLIIMESLYDNYGYGLALGDYNADGYHDIAIAASHEYDPWPSGTFYGFVWIYGGNAQLEDTTVANEDLALPGLTDQLQVSISPNPACASAGNIRIEIKGQAQPADGRIELFNLKGQRIYSVDAPAFQQNVITTIPITDLPSGIYLCRVSYGKQASTSKLSIVK